MNHVKRLLSDAQNTDFEGQLPKLRYYHHVKKAEPQEVNNNVKSQPITASSKKNGSTGQMKITGELSIQIVLRNTPEPGNLHGSSPATFCEATDNIFPLLPSTDFLKEKKRLTVTTKKRQ